MTIKTLYEIGDKLHIAGRDRVIVSVHIYVSAHVQTERYYLGGGDWLTIKVKKAY